MVRKRKKIRKPRPGGSKPQAELTWEELEARGKDLLEARRYKDAGAIFKQLVRREARAEWIESLAAAYAGRARGLADKGMYKEALAIWRNRAEACGRALVEPEYFALLFRTGQIEPAARLIQEQREAIEAHGSLDELRTLCAAQALAGNEGILEAFAADDRLNLDFPPARGALQAYCEGSDGAMEEQLKGIPFRSPFRDLRPILKALALLGKDGAGVERLLARVGAASPFSVLCEAVRASRLPDRDFLARYRGMEREERRFAAVLKGWSPEQISLAQELNQLGESPSAAALLRFLLSHRQALGEDYVRGIGRRLLISYPRGRAVFVKAFGPLSEFQQGCNEALRLEQEEEAPPHVVYNAWLEAYDAIRKLGFQVGSSCSLNAALILRRAARHWLETQPANRQTLKALDDSLAFDPDDRSTSLQLIRLYREKRSLKDARRLLDDALSRYPADTDVLIEAVQTAIAGGAFKKATRYARRTLELDPINPRVRGILVNSHLAHARKLIRQKKIPLARKELDETSSWARSEVAKGRIDLLRGLLELNQGEIQAARKLFLCGFEQTGGALVGRLYLLLEAGHMDHSLASLLKQARLPKLPRKPGREPVLALVRTVNELGDEDQELLMEAVENLEGPLMAAAELHYSFAEMELICETWLRLEQHELRSRYARAALKHWRDAPVFVFHRVDADGELSMGISLEDLDALEAAQQQAHRDGDMRSDYRIGELLRETGPFVGMGDDEAFDPFDRGGFPGDLDIEELIDRLMEAEGPPDVEELKRELGPEGARLLFEAMLRGQFDPSRMADILGEATRPQPRKGSRKKSSKPKPEQFDLF